MTVAIVGGAGFVGTRLAKVFDEQSVEYSIFDKVLDGAGFLDITKPESFETMPTPEVVINLAAEHRDDVTPTSLYDLVNVEGSENICQFCRQRGVNTIVFTSSVSVYGIAPEDTDESGEINFFNDYGRTKYLAENVYREWFNEDPSHRTLVIVRPTVIFGEGNRGNVYNLIQQISRGRFIMVGSGKNKKSMAYVGNVASCLAFLTKNTKGYHLYNYVDKPDLDMNTLATLAIRQIHGEGRTIGYRMPLQIGLIIGYAFDMVARITRRKFSVSSIRIKKFVSTTMFATNVQNSGFSTTGTLAENLIKTINFEKQRNGFD